MIRLVWIATLVFAFAGSFCGRVSGADFAAAAAGPESDKLRAMIGQLITDQVRHSLPDTYEDKSHWGMTKTTFDGLKITRDGLNLKTHRRTKEANHGSWRAYELTLIEPQQNLRIELSPLRNLSDGRTAFDVTGSARIHIVGRLAQWERDVQLAAIGIKADSTVRFRISLAVAVEMESTAVLPGFTIKPQATDVNLSLDDFRLTRVGQLKGPLVEQLSGGVRDAAEHFLDKKRQKLVDSVNRQIAKNQDKMRFSLDDYALSHAPVLKSLFGAGWDGGGTEESPTKAPASEPGKRD